MTRGDATSVEVCALPQAAGLAVIATGPAGDIRFMNRAAEALTGWDAREAVGRPLWAVLRLEPEPSPAPPGRSPAAPGPSPAARPTEPAAPGAPPASVVLVGRSGARTAAEVCQETLPGSGEGPALAITVFRDLTHRRMAEAALRAEHAEKEQFLSAISSILIGVSKEGRVTQWNGEAARTLGLSADQVVGRPLRACPVPWQWSKVDEGLAQCRATRRPVRVDDIRFTGPDGKPGFLGITLNPIAAEDAADVGILVLGRNITGRKFTEAQLAQAQKLEAIGQLAAGIAHEINTPIQYVGDNTRFLSDAFAPITRCLGVLQKILEAAGTGPVPAALLAEAQEAVRQADVPYLLAEAPAALAQSLEGIERVTRIVRAMKEFAHPSVEAKVAADLNKAVQSTVLVCRNEWKYVADLELDLDPALPPVPCYPSDVNQAILNLVLNAAHAVGQGMGPGSAAKGTISVRTRRDGDWVEVRVSDTGTGIPEAIRDRIFEPFFTTKEVGKGTGQGLAIAHAAVVKKHGGSIGFETEVGKGTTFTVRLPLAAGPE